MPVETLTDRGVAAKKATGSERIELWDTTMRGLCLRVSAKSRVWIFRYRHPSGTQPRVRLGHYVSPEHADGDKNALTVAGARMKARKLRSAVDDGGDPATDLRTAKAESKAQPIKTVGDLAAGYFEACETGEYRPRKKRKRPATIKGERYIWRKYLSGLDDVRVETLSRDSVKKLLRDLLLAGKGVTSNRVRALLRQVYAWGMAEGRVGKNPAAEIDDLAEETPRARVLTDKELKSLWEALVDPSDLRRVAAGRRNDRVYVSRPVRIAMQLAALTLQRRGEIMRMRVEDVDLACAVWKIPAEATKAGRATAVPLGPLAIGLIREAIALRPEPNDGEPPSIWVFRGRADEDQPFDPSAISHAMRDIRAGLGIPDITVHDLRRSGASRLAAAGVSPFIISQILNHAGDLGGGAAITMSVYVKHDYMPERRAALELLERLLLEVVGG